MFQQIQDVNHQRKLPCFVGHIRAHPNLPGPLAEGSALADKFTQFTTLSQLELAQQSYAMNHHNSKSLRKQFGLTREIACQIVLLRNVIYLSVSHLGVKP